MMTPEGELDQNTKTSLANQKTLTMLTLVAPKTEARALKINALQAMYKPFKPADCPEGLNRGEPGEREGGSKKRFTGSSYCHPLILVLAEERNTPSEM